MEDSKKKCPYCGELIMADAKKCRHCGEWFTDETGPIEKHENRSIQDILKDSEPIEESSDVSIQSKPQRSLFKSCFWDQTTKHYCDFKGAIDRKTYWVWYLYYTLVMYLISGVSAIIPVFGALLTWVILLGLILPSLGLSVRRLKDLGKKWTWIFIALIPIVGPIWLFCFMIERGECHNPNKWTRKDTYITIGMIIMSIFLFVVGVWVGGTQNNVETEIEKQVVEDYNTFAIYDRLTPDFEAAYDAAFTAEDYSGYLCVDADIFYQTQDLDFDNFNVVAKADLVDKDKALVSVTLYSEPHPSLVLVMIRNKRTGEWLVDDVTDEKNRFSFKEVLIECAKSLMEKKFVVIEVSDLRIRRGPSENSETLKWSNGKNRHPNIGDEFEYLGESGDFYKINYEGQEVWVSKKYSHIKEKK